LIGVYDKLLDPPKLPHLLSLFTSVASVVLSCFILLADSYRFPDDIYMLRAVALWLF